MFSGLLMFFLVTTPVDPVQRGARGMGVDLDVLPMLPVIVLLPAPPYTVAHFLITPCTYCIIPIRHSSVVGTPS